MGDDVINEHLADGYLDDLVIIVSPSGRPSSKRDDECICNFNPETTDGPEEDCPFHGRPYSYWVRAVNDHAGCQSAFDRERRRADFAEARLTALISKFRALAQQMDGIQGHVTHERLGGKTLSGSIRWTLSDLRNLPEQQADQWPTQPPFSHS